MRGNALFLATVMLAASFGFSGERAAATGTPISLCNRSQDTISIAYGYRSSGPNDTDTELTGPFVSTGWRVLHAGDCAEITNPFGARYMYWTGYVWNGAFLWKDGDKYFCVPNTTIAPPKFTFERQNESRDACVDSDPYDSGGANMWVAAREVDVEVDASAEYDGS